MIDEPSRRARYPVQSRGTAPLSRIPAVVLIRVEWLHGPRAVLSCRLPASVAVFFPLPNGPNDMQDPFFILGCVRSGSTLLRDLLRLHPNLECPEETHFFRWPQAFGTNDYNFVQNQRKVLAEHRKIDGIPEETFADILAMSANRREFCDRYMRCFLKNKGCENSRWFDKTPQSVYGVLLIKAFYPSSKFIHIVRNPLNVVSSIVRGHMVSSQSLTGAINYWLEAIMIVRQFESAWPASILEVRYEDLTTDPQSILKEILDFVEEREGTIDLRGLHIHREKNEYRKVLVDKDIDRVKKQLSDYMESYGYL